MKHEDHRDPTPLHTVPLDQPEYTQVTYETGSPSSAVDAICRILDAFTVREQDAMQSFVSSTYPRWPR